MLCDSCDAYLRRRDVWRTFHRVAGRGHTACLEALLDAGFVPPATACLDAAHEGYAACVALLADDDERASAASVVALARGHEVVVRTLVFQGRHLSPLVLEVAVTCGLTAATRDLLASGTEPSVKAWHAAATGTSVRILQLLLSRAVPPPDLLTLAERQGSPDVVERLRKHFS
jgi:hypothetical protein